MPQLVHAPRGNGVLVVAAHPDDETIGCGGVLGGTHEARVAYLTDGVPSDVFLVPAAFRNDRELYRETRSEEARRALGLAEIGEFLEDRRGGTRQRDAVVVVLSRSERRCKELMMRCFETQKEVLAPFGIESSLASTIGAFSSAPSAVARNECCSRGQAA